MTNYKLILYKLILYPIDEFILAFKKKKIVNTYNDTYYLKKIE